MKLLLCVFALLAATEKSSQLVCQGTTGTSCTKCYSQNQGNTIVGATEQTYSLQRCDSSCKAVSIKLTFGEKKYFRAATTCCDTDNCNAVPAVPPADSKESNLACPACFAFATSCEATLIKCPESEDQCVTIFGLFSEGTGIRSFYGRGCGMLRGTTDLLGDAIYTSQNSLFQIYGFNMEKATEKVFTCHDSTAQSKTCIGTKCYSQQQENTIGVPLEKYSLQSCLPSCKAVSLKLTFGEKKYFRAATTCCDTDNCNAIPAVPPADSKESNLACPACFAFATSCEATWIKCPESEDQCVTIFGLFSEGTGIRSFYGRGCGMLRGSTDLLRETIYTSQNSLFQIYGFNMEKATEKVFTCHDSTAQSKTCIGTKCYSQQQENTIVGVSLEKYSLQSCLPSCKAVSLKLTFGEKKYFRAATTCCDTDNCNAVPAVPPADGKESNLGCPACFALSSTSCEATWIKCPESEDQCMNISGIYHDASGKKSFYGRGCTTTSAKDITVGDTIATGPNSVFEILAINVEKATEKVFTCHDPTAQSKNCIGTKCYSQNQKNTIVGESEKAYSLQSCLKSCTEGNLKFTFGEKKYFRMATKCCDIDNCNAVPEVSTADEKESELECPACFAFSSTPCEATWINCPEKEDQCVNITGIFHEASGKKTFYGRGCATAAAKTLVPNDKIDTDKGSWFQVVAIDTEKANNSWSVHGSFTVTLLLSGLIGIQLTNIF